MPAPATEAALLEALKSVVDPNTGKDFVTSKALKNLRVDGGDVSFAVEMGYPAKSQHAALRKALIAAARSVAGRYHQGASSGTACAGPQATGQRRHGSNAAT